MPNPTLLQQNIRADVQRWIDRLDSYQVTEIHDDMIVDPLRTIPKEAKIQQILALPQYLIDRIWEREGLGEQSQDEMNADENRSFEHQRSIQS